MVDPTLTITIDQTSIGRGPLVMSASDDGQAWGLVTYAEPALQARTSYAADSPYLNGSVATSSTWQQTLLGFDACAEVSSELELRVRMAELRLALSQFTYPVTVALAGFSETWRCDRGSIGAVTRDQVNLRHFTVVFPITVPCQPIQEA